MHINIIQRDIEVMFRSRKSIICNNRIPWVKKQGKGFDVTMGAYDGADICDWHIYVVINRKKYWIILGRWFKHI